MPEFDSSNLIHIIFLVITAIITGGFSLQALAKHWKSNDAESSLLKIMHEELERMSLQNTSLSVEIGKLQIELVKLSAQLTTLNIENQKLQTEISQLNGEIARLHSIIVVQQKANHYP